MKSKEINRYTKKNSFMMDDVLDYIAEKHKVNKEKKKLRRK